MTTVLAGLSDNGIRLRSYAPGDHKCLCPKCSHTRKKKNDPCLSVTIGPCQLKHGALPADEAIWNCHNCEFSGSTLHGTQHRGIELGGKARNKPLDFGDARRRLRYQGYGT